MIFLKDVSYEVDGKKILSNVNLAIDMNKLNVIVGVNGAGKSTLLKLIEGIIKPSSGTIEVDGFNLTDMDVTARFWRNFIYAYQIPVVFKGIKVKRLMDLVNSTGNWSQIFSELNIPEEFMDREFDKSFSGGERKKIELALAFGSCHKLLLDEPEAGVDGYSLPNIISRIKSGLIVTHSKDLIEKADVIYEVKDGGVNVR